jgi:hypothetical protein
MPIFGNPIGGPESFNDFKWQGWTWWYQDRKFNSTPSPVLWDVKSGCVEKFQEVPFIITEPPPA